MVSFYNQVVRSAREAAGEGSGKRELVLEVTETAAGVGISLSRSGELNGRACWMSPDEGVVLIAALEKAVQLARVKRSRAEPSS